jgi:hypothetical protein
MFDVVNTPSVENNYKRDKEKDPYEERGKLTIQEEVKK